MTLTCRAPAISPALRASAPRKTRIASLVRRSASIDDDETPTAVSSAVEDAAMTFELKTPTTPTRFKVADGKLFDVATAAVPLTLRLTSGLATHGYAPTIRNEPLPSGRYSVWSNATSYVDERSDVSAFARPTKPIKIYQFQGCPFCRKVREAVIGLDLDVTYYPTPQGGPEYRPFVASTGGKSQFPYMIDENTGESMYESDAIIEYLYEKYGPGKDKVSGFLTSPITPLAAGLSMIPRMGKGSRYRPSKKPENMQPITFWGYEASPFCALVTEVLNELELPYNQRSCGRGSPKRQELFDKRGTFQVPYIEDPNTGIAMFESADIVQYLEETYAA